MKIKQKQILPSLLCLLLAWVAASCREEVEMQEANGQGYTVTLNIDLGDKNTPKTPVTRAGIPDNQIDEIDVLTFIVDPAEPDNIDKGTFFQRAQAELSTGADGKLRAKVRLLGNSSLNQHILVLANVRQRLNAMTLTYGMETITALYPLHIYVGADGKVDDSRPIPMAGILPRQVIDESYATSEKEATMLRMFAKITVDAGADLIHELHLYNGRRNGRVIPYDGYYDKVNKNVIQTPWGWEVYPGPIDYTPGTPVQRTSFYTNEIDNSHKAANLMDVTYLTVKATHRGGTGAPTWYRIDLKDYAAGYLLDILRNHEYYIKLNESGRIQEPGGATEEDARQGLHKLNVQILGWRFGGGRTQAPGDPTQKKLAVLETDLTIDGANESPLNIYADGGGWHITGLPHWAQASQINGGNGWVTVRISSREANLTRVERHATIHVHNGRARMEVQLHQPDGCMPQPNGQPRQLIIRGQKYNVARLIPGGRCWMLDAYREPINMYRPANGTWGPLYTPAWDMPPVSDGWRIPNTADLRDFLDSPYIRLRDNTPAGPNPVLGRIYSSGRGFVESGTGDVYTDIVRDRNTYVDANNVVIILVNGKEQYVEIPAPYTTRRLFINGVKLPEIRDFNTWTDGAGAQQYGWNYVPTNMGHTYLLALPSVHESNNNGSRLVGSSDEVRWQLINQLGFPNYPNIFPLSLRENQDYVTDFGTFDFSLRRGNSYSFYNQAHMFRRSSNPPTKYNPGSFPFHIPSHMYSHSSGGMRPLNSVLRFGTSSSLTEMGGSIRLVHD